VTEQGFDDAVVDRVLTHMNDDHAEDSLVIALAHGYPAATAAEMTGVDPDGGTWHVVDATGEATLRVTWPDGPIAADAIRHQVVVVHDAARAALGLPPRV